MNNPIRTAIASFGMSGQVFHGPLLKENPQFQVVKVFERSKNISRKLFPNANIVRTYEEILCDDNIELIVVNTPDVLHYKMAKQALEAGKHVVVEKPLTQKSNEAKELLSLARSKGVVFTVYQNRRWDGDFRTVQKVLDEGKLGRLIEFESHFDRFRTYIAPDTWKEEGDEYTGVLYNLGSHLIDQAYVLFGMPKMVTSHLQVLRKNGVVTDYFDVRLQYEGFAAILKCSYLVKDPGPRFSIYGEKGTFRKWGIDPQEGLLKAGHLPNEEDWGAEPAELWGTMVYEDDEEDVEELVETIPGDYKIFYNNLFEAIRNGANLLVKPEEAIDVLNILEACLLSNREKRTIEI